MLSRNQSLPEERKKAMREQLDFLGISRARMAPLNNVGCPDEPADGATSFVQHLWDEGRGIIRLVIGQTGGQQLSAGGWAGAGSIQHAQGTRQQTGSQLAVVKLKYSPDGSLLQDSSNSTLPVSDDYVSEEIDSESGATSTGLPVEN